MAQREEKQGFLERALALADRLESADLAAALLRPFTLNQLTSRAAPRLIALSQRYGLEWCRTLLESWASASRCDLSGRRDAARTASLPALCRPLGAGGSAEGLTLARWLVTQEWTRLGREWMELREEPNPTITLDILCRMSQPILGALEGSLIANNPELHREALHVLTAAESEYPIRGLIHLLRTACKTRAGDALRHLSLARLHGHCVQTLKSRLGAPLRGKGNWSITGCPERGATMTDARRFASSCFQPARHRWL